MNLNVVMVAGNLTRDVELKYTQSNKAVASFGIAINSKYKTADGTMKEDVTFLDCEAWGNTAEAMAKYLSKGRAVFLSGKLRVDVWDDKQTGAKRSKVKVVVDSFQFVGPKPDGGGDGYAAAPTPVAARRVEAGVPPANMKYERIDESDIPW